MYQDWSVLTGTPAHSEGRSSLPGDRRQTHWDWEITTTAGAHARPPAFMTLMHEVHAFKPKKKIFAFMH